MATSPKTSSASVGSKQSIEQTVKTWVANLVAERPVTAGIALCVLVLLCLVLLFWFVVFSDFGGSADFIYAQF